MKWPSNKLTPVIATIVLVVTLVVLSFQNYDSVKRWNTENVGSLAKSELELSSTNTNSSSSSSSSSRFQVTALNEDDPVKACFVVLVRNKELDGMISTMEQLERTFNSKFNYPYVFLNDEEFTDEFKEKTSNLTNAKTHYGLVEGEMWGYPSFINQTYAAGRRAKMKEQNIPYADSESYRHMCRFQSGFFFRHPLMADYDYYWRIEPYVDYTCDIDYDVFKFMRNNKKIYGFTITFREFMGTVPTLWQTIMNFKRDNPDVVSQWPSEADSLTKFVTDDGVTYNSCHFWTNFEIASLKLWRSDDYLKLFNYLDQEGGFFYERWGDAPVHSIAASLMLRKEDFHFFNDIGYKHSIYTHCPIESKYRNKCSCDPADTLEFQNGPSCYYPWLKATL